LNQEGVVSQIFKTEIQRENDKINQVFSNRYMSFLGDKNRQ